MGASAPFFYFWRLMKFLKWVWSFTEEPLKNFIYNETFILLAAKLPIVPKWCLKAVLRWTLDKTINQVVDASYRELGYKIEVKNGEILLKKIQNSTPTEWDDLSSRV